MAQRSTGRGVIEGVERLGVEQYRGIRFAEPPTGDRRFRPPVPAVDWTAGWDGTLDATVFAARAPQPEMAGVFGKPTGVQNEDCLFLNLYTPAGTEPGAGLPVLFWIHGGAYRSGSANDFNGTVLCRQGDVVVVAINYRLGALGFLDVSDLDPSYAGSAANGIRDQICALRWVRDHVADFGGDPGNVTIFGESAGAGSVLALLASPEADGLYHRAMANSPGGMETPPARGRSTRFADSLGSTGEPLDRLLAADVEELLAVQIAHQFGGGAIDGTVVTRHPVEAIRERGADGVPLIVGTNLDEGPLFTIAFVDDPDACVTSAAQVATQVTRNGDVDRYLADVRRTHPDDDAYATANRVWNDLFRRSSVEAAEAATSAGPGGWLYRFEVPTTVLGGALGVAHAAEIPFTFNWFASDEPMGFNFHDRDDPANIELAHRWSETVLAFARTGDPNAGTLPDWPRYDTGDRACMILDVAARIESDPDGTDRERWI
jgi:para-nitrobenzyl esterase